jgi:DNA-binding FrmR family transcriptional regulator
MMARTIRTTRRAGPRGGAPSSAPRAGGADATIKDAHLKHLRRIEGQVRGVAAMIEADRSCADIITQVSAVRESLHAVARNLMGNHLRRCAPAALCEGGAARDAMIDELLDLVGKVSR